MVFVFAQFSSWEIYFIIVVNPMQTSIGILHHMSHAMHAE